MTNAVFINRIASVLPNEPVSNAQMEDVLGLANGKRSRAKNVVLRSNGIKTRYYVIDPETGERTRAVFSCAEQEQPLAWIDLNNLRDRQMQNRLPDTLAAKWVEEMIPPLEEDQEKSA